MPKAEILLVITAVLIPNAYILWKELKWQSY